MEPLLHNPLPPAVFNIPITWNIDIGTVFTLADLNATTNNSSLRANVSALSVTRTGIEFLATVNLTGGGSGVVTVYINRGAIPATPSTGSSLVLRQTYNAALPPPPPPTGTRSGPGVTQSGGSVLLKPDEITDVDPPVLDIVISNIQEAKMTSNTPVDVVVSFIFDKTVDGFGEGTPNYRFIPRDVDAIVPRKIPKLGTFSGVEGNATYRQIIEIQPDSSGKINIYVPANSARLLPPSTTNNDTYGPEPPGELAEIFYDTTIAGNPAPNVSISTPPTTYFSGETYTVTFSWDQPIEQNTFRSAQVNVVGATAGSLEPDPNRRDLFTMELTLPETGIGEVTISVYAHRIVSTAATGIVSRREGPTNTESETFLYNREYTSPGTVIQGASTICEITQPIATNTYLDQALASRSSGGAFAGVSDMVYITDEPSRTGFLYFVVQQIKRRAGTTNTLSNRTEAGAFLMEVNLKTNRCSVIKSWAYITVAGRSLTAHNGRLYWFEGSHYGNRSRGPDGGDTPDEDGNLPVNYAATVGNVFSLAPGTRNIRNHGVNWRSQFEYPDDSQVVDDYGFHTQTASPMRSDGENLYLISGFGGLQTINSPNYATSRRGPQGVDPVTDIGNWQLIKYSQDIEQRIWLFDGNGKKGWDAIRELATLTNSFIGLDKHGLFYFESKGGLRAKVQNSAPGSIEFRDPTDIFPQKGLIEINGELITYDGIIGRQFLNVDRAQYGTNQASHCSGSPIRLIKAVLNDGQKVFEPVQDADIRSNTKQLYNKIIITYDGGTFEYQDNASILRYGEKVYNMTIPLTVQQTDWISEVGRRFVEAHKEIHYLITLTMIEDLSLEVTDVVFLKDTSTMHSLIRLAKSTKPRRIL